jgi:hypothetical protein
METITAEVRVTNLNVQPFAFRRDCSRGSEGEMMVGGESVVLKASGFWEDSSPETETKPDQYPVSVHLTVYPGHGIIPVLGDTLKITVERGN